jgi:hypothetical protein
MTRKDVKDSMRTRETVRAKRAMRLGDEGTGQDN